jgi:LacI family transcriptional regulator
MTLDMIYYETYECQPHIVMSHNKSNTNGSNWTLENRLSRSTTGGINGTTYCVIVLQTNPAFTRSVLNAIRRVTRKGLHGVSIHAVASHSDEETLELIRKFRHQSDVFALLGKNTDPVKAALLELRSGRVPVIAFVSDLAPNVRSTYIGSDNRAAGQLAGFIFGRSLERELDARVAVVAGKFPYRCWEDREIGFRTLLRERFPQINVVEAVMENDSPQATCEEVLRVLKNGHAIGGIYNPVGESLGLGQAINEVRVSHRPLYITHELDEIAEPLLRAGAIDFLITQNLESLVNTVKRFVITLRTGANQCEELNLVPVELVSKFNLHPRTVL